MKKIRLTMHADCPSCKEAEEDIHHILNCEERAHKTNKIFMMEFKKNYKTCQDQDNILDQIITSVRQSSNQYEQSMEFGKSNKTWMGFVVERIRNQGMASNYGKISSKKKLERYNVQYHCGNMEDMDCNVEKSEQ